VSLRAADALPAAWQSPFRQANYVKREIASGKTPEDAANIAMALMEVYRNRPPVRRLAAPQQDALQRDIDKAFEAVMQHRDAMEITVTTPMSEAMGKIDAIIFGGA
jgi:hypothetical protein